MQSAPLTIVIDAMCAEYGGIRTYVVHLLRRWAQEFPDDRVHVALRAGSTLPTPGLHRHELVVGRPDVLRRPWAQATCLHQLVKEVRPDVVLATAPTTNPRRMPAPLAVVILDLRADLRPEQFSLGRRLLRKISYGRTYHLADGFLSISQRSLDDLHRLHPLTRSKPGVVTHLAGEHVLDWPEPSWDGPAIGFAHHTNKNPELLVEAWALLRNAGMAERLTLLGVSRELRPRLEELITRLDLADQVSLAPFLPDEQFRDTILRSRLVALPSDFEGFGIPILEGMLLHKPVVIGPDPGSLETAGDHATVAADWTPKALAVALTEGLQRDQDSLDAARDWAARFTWNRTLHATRDALAEMAAGNRR
jgi:glycosyltransferase involved in cell wall biosynthesis